MKVLFILSFILFPGFTLRSQDADSLPFTKGVYGDPGALLLKGMSFKSLGINAIFVRSSSLNADLYSTARKEGVRIYVEFPTLNGKEYLVQHPGAWPINEKGERAPPADWFMGICLTDPGFRKSRIQELKTDLAGISGGWYLAGLSALACPVRKARSYSPGNVLL